MVRKLVKLTLILALAGVFVAAGALLTIYVLGLPQPELQVQPFEVDPQPGRVARGRKLAAMLCHRCHFSSETGALTGRSLALEQVGLGDVYASNITADLSRGIGDWPDEELVHLLRTSVHPRTGQQTPPYMPHFPNIADEDLRDLLAFLRSDDPWVRAQRTKDRPSEPSLKATLLTWLRWQPGPELFAPRLRPSDDELLALGAYLATDLLQCHGCHSAKRDDVDRLDPAQTPGFLGGGAVLHDVAGQPIRGTNLTFASAGLAEWSYEDFRRALVEGIGKDGRLVRWPMPRYPELDELELEALYAYLGALPPIERETPPSYEYRRIAKLIDPGRHAYYEHGCQYCHPDRGDGLGSLKAMTESFPEDDALAAFITDPRSVRPDSRMPAFGEIIPAEEVPALVDYLRRRAESGPEAPPEQEFSVTSP